MIMMVMVVDGHGDGDDGHGHGHGHMVLCRLNPKSAPEKWLITNDGGGLFTIQMIWWW